MKQFSLLLILSCLYFSGFSQQQGFVLVKGGKIYYRTFGEGKPLLIINGGPGMNSDGFVELAKTLSAKNKTILFDQRGTGQSTLDTVNSSTITMDAMVDDMETLRNHLGISSWTILGHSFGGMLASYYTTIHPKNVNGIILSASGGIDLELLSYVSANINKRLTKQQADSLDYWIGRINNGDTSKHAQYQRAFSLAPAYVYNKEFVPIIAERLTQGNARINSLVWQDLQRMRFDCSKQLTSFTKPVLIMQGKQDIIEVKTAQKAKNTFPKSKLVLLDNCVHYGWLDAPTTYYKEVNTFLAQLN